MEDELSKSESEAYNKKHKRIRGTLDLKYPPRVSRCKSTCGYWHYNVEVRGKPEQRQHPCFLVIDHAGPCEFTSECGLILTGRAAA